VGIGLYYEGGPPPDVADRINASFPNYLQKPLHQRIVVDIAEKDRFVHWQSGFREFLKDVFRETLDGLRRVGFRLNTGIDGTGFILLAWTKASGYYFGATSQKCIFFVTEPINPKHRCWRESADHRRKD
jgi:hypothetical protein